MEGPNVDDAKARRMSIEERNIEIAKTLIMPEAA